MIRIALLIIIPFLLFSKEPIPKHILLLNSYNQTMTWVQDITKAVNDVLKPQENNLIIHIENMDTKRIYTTEHLNQLKNTYREKYKNIDLSLILSSDNNALEFLKKNRDELFGNIPVVFSGINFFKDSDLYGYSNYTGITEEFDLLGTLRTAIKLKPFTKEVFIINDYLTSGVAWKKTMKEQLKYFNHELKITYSPNSSIEELKTQLSALSKDTIVILGVYFKDKEGTYFTYEKIGEILSVHSNVPVFALLEFNLKEGVVGGNVIGGYYQGAGMSKIAQQVLKGKDVLKIPVQKTGTVESIYNYEELKKHKLDVDKLPKNSTIIKKPKNDVFYTKEELKYLKSKKRITMCIDPDWMPFEKLDNQGNHIGLSRDYFILFEKKIGVPIEVIPTVSWSDSLRFANERKCDILSLAMSTPKRDKYLNFTSSYVNLPLVLATKENITFIDNFKQLNKKRIGMVKSYAYNELLRSKYPNVEIIDVKNTKEGLSLVVNEKLFGFVGSIADIGYVFQRNFFGDIKISGKFDEKWNLGVAVRNDDSVLLGIFEKNVKHLSEDTKQKILNKHIAIKYEKGVDYTLLLEVLIVVFVVFLAFLYRHLVLKRSNEILDIKVKEKTQELEELNINLENKIDSRTHLLAIKAHRLNYLLDNTSQGFLSFGHDFLIEYEYSIECEKLLEKELNNKDIAILLFKNKPEKVVFFKETILDAYNANNELTASLLLSLLPKELVVNKRALQLEYKILANNKFMLILTNITERVKLQTKIKNEQEILKMIVSIVSDNVLFYETKRNFEQFCNEYNIYINSSNSSKENAQTIYILIHTFKGIFAQLYMKNMVRKLHDFESLLSEFIDAENNNNEELRQLFGLKSLSSFIEEDLDIVTNALGEPFLNEDTFLKINKKSIYELEEKIEKLKSLNKNNANYSELLDDLQSLKNKSLKDYLCIYPKLCEQLCLSLNKSIQTFEIDGDSSVLVPESFNPFINSLIHVFRNCCDHGIETKEQRVLRNKSDRGIVSCSFKKEENFIYVEISDDGSGIDVLLVKEKALQRGLITKSNMDMLSETEILNFIFHTQFSTHEAVSELSGRGVGLSAVKKYVEQLNGSIEVKTKKDKGTSFIFKVSLGL